MTALSNANTSWDGIKSHSIGLTSFVLPKANSSDTGVSVRYVLKRIFNNDQLNKKIKNKIEQR